MVVDRRHLEDTAAGSFVKEDLDDHRQSLDDKEASDDAEHDLVLGGNGNRAERATESKAAGVAHENGSGRRIIPQEGETGADDRRTEHCQITGIENMGN